MNVFNFKVLNVAMLSRPEKLALWNCAKDIERELVEKEVPLSKLQIFVVTRAMYAALKTAYAFGKQAGRVSLN
ncbi:MAG: hypothetical protein DWQ07_13970 [Chloroflexi bacterium]|nr:MAG: hypothetical protein DWQ07_13970 [Chloroflexota bacterium]